LTDFCDENSLQHIESGTISYRSNDSVRAESALSLKRDARVISDTGRAESSLRQIAESAPTRFVS
jgi:hypothetical protein